MRHFIAIIACCFFVLFAAAPPLADAALRKGSLDHESPDYERLTENDWPEFRDHFNRLRDLDRIADLQDEGDLDGWNYLEGLSRLVRISWPEERREEIAEYLLDLALELLRKPGYLDGAALPLDPHEILRGEYFGQIEVFSALLEVHGILARKADVKKLTELHRFAQTTPEEEATVRWYLMSSFLGILSNAAPGEGVAELMHDWAETASDDEKDLFQRLLTRRTHKAFPSNSPIPDAEMPVRFEAVVGHVDFADADRKIPRFIVGETISFRMIVRNDGEVPFSYDSGFLPPRCVSGDHISLIYTANPAVSDHYARTQPAWAPFPIIAESIVTLQPGEERSHDTLIFENGMWCGPVRGSWVNSFGCGEIGHYRAEFNNPVPEGWADFLRKNGYETELADRTLFEGRFRGVCEFELISPPIEWKERVLSEIKVLMAGKDDIDITRLNTLFLRGYHLAPQELEDFLFKNIRNPNRERVIQAYDGLEMFDTPRARTAVAAIKNWTPGTFDIAGAWVLSHLGLFDPPLYDSGDRGLYAYLCYSNIRPAFLMLLTAIGGLLAILFFTVRFFLKRKRNEIASGDFDL